MKFSEQWLREWVNPPINTSELVEQLTLAGLEVEDLIPVASPFKGVVIGLVKKVAPHPDADRLRVCQVDVGSEILEIVCGANNVKEGLKVPVALIDGILPGDFKIKKSKLRGVDSYGMICSESELGLAEQSDGIMELPSNAPVGQDLRDYLKLDDFIIDVNLTPNRGDCFSILGMAREVAALNDLNLQKPPITFPRSTLTQTLPVKIHAPEACLRYVGRVIRRLNTHAITPLWMQEKLRRSGIRAISPVVDVTNYVLLELGQPLHAFDLNFVSKGIEVRFAHENEMINLLDDQPLSLSPQNLLITSDNKPVALAGIKGGKESSITSDTQDIFLESALFRSDIIAKTTQKIKINTDSSMRFERGVDPSLQREAIEWASQLIIDIAGGEAGEIIDISGKFSEPTSITLRYPRVEAVLGISLPSSKITSLLNRLNMSFIEHDKGCQVTPPSYRSDITSEIDLIEEIARLYGYQNIPAQKFTAPINFLPVKETKLDIYRLKTLLADRGYQEVISYSFVDPIIERRLALQPEPLALLNPISSDLSVMRTNHWAGLIKIFQYNHQRQQPRIRLFEVGLCFTQQGGTIAQTLHLGGLCSGPLVKEQWGDSKRSIDFFDVKADIENILILARQNKNKVKFEPYEHAALHPGKTAAIVINNIIIGYVGALHPSLMQEFELNQPLYLFDINLESIMDVPLPSYEAFSKFPAIRRDLAIVVAEKVLAQRIEQKILDSGGELLKNVQIFDVYQGKGIEPGKKSIALSLYFQDLSRTLVDSEINALMENIVTTLNKEFDAILRD